MAPSAENGSEAAPKAEEAPRRNGCCRRVKSQPRVGAFETLCNRGHLGKHQDGLPGKTTTRVPTCTRP
jgi:hypothetical protein